MTKPTPQYDDRSIGEHRDYAGSGAFSLYALERMLRDCAEQPNWRLRAKLCAAYYDGKQLTELQRAKIREEDLEERVINLIRPVVNSVLGQEAKSRTDVRVEADDDSHADVAEVISGKLKEAERETSAHMAVSEAYASQVKKGLGWVNVSRVSDPLAYPYRVEFVPMDEIWWDWRGQRGNTLEQGCRWQVRMRFIDLDEVQAAMPKHKDILARCVNGWDAMYELDGAMVGRPEQIAMEEAFQNESRFNLVIPKFDWVDSARKMVKLYEVWYRVPAQTVVLHLGPTTRVEYDQNDPRHVQAVSRGLVKISKGITSQVRRALYAGPHRLLDEATTLRRFPYVPFFAFRDDNDKSPYGLIDGMVAPQDEYNERRHHIQWMLKARQLQMDSDALDPLYNTIADIAESAMRPDMVAITNPNRVNKKLPAISIKSDLQMQPEQFNILADSKQLIQDTAGRYSSQLGNRPAGVTSGIANSLLIEQGEQAMGEMNDNYSTARRTVFELLVDLIVEDHSQERMQVPVGTGKSRRMVVLNDWDPQTSMPINMVKDANITTGLAETPNTPAYRQQQQQQLSTIIQALGNNPQATAILAPAYVESTNIPNRGEVADALRKASGIPLPGDKDGQAKADAMAEQQLALKQQNEQAAAEAKRKVDETAAEKNMAQARHYTAQADFIASRIAAGTAPAEVQRTLAQAHAAGGPEEDEDALISSALQHADQPAASAPA